MSQGLRTDLDSPYPAITSLLDVVPDLVALADDDGRPVTFPASALGPEPELAEARRRLLGVLGVQIDDDEKRSRTA